MNDSILLAIGENPVQAGLLGAGAGGGRFGIRPGRDQPVGGEDRQLDVCASISRCSESYVYRTSSPDIPSIDSEIRPLFCPVG